MPHMTATARNTGESLDVDMAIDDLIARGRAAMDIFENDNQVRIDEAVTALAWSIYKPENAEALAELAVEECFRMEVARFSPACGREG